ncbi:MAG: hypothetical protein LUO79_01795, partial [Methanomassiliicoccales archaeon]|nr:hypothetical protein [Methanomassiliicoccales archaeon]
MKTESKQAAVNAEAPNAEAPKVEGADAEGPQIDGTNAEGAKFVYKRPALLREAHFHYCPGCGHGIINRLLMEVIEEMGL